MDNEIIKELEKIENSTVYGIVNYMNDTYTFFDTRSQLNDYIIEFGKGVFDSIFSIMYIGVYLNKTDVIRITNLDGNIVKYMTQVGDDSYIIFNEENNTWEYDEGSINEYYEALDSKLIRTRN